MARDKQNADAAPEAGAPEWMVTFSDCMTLLLTFFVLLLSFSSFDNQDDYLKMTSSMAQQFSFGQQSQTEKDSVVFIREQVPNYELDWGSEKKTLEEKEKNRSRNTTSPADYLKYKKFVMPSSEAFWGKGMVLSVQGKQALYNLALFLKEFPNHLIMVSESGSSSDELTPNYGIQRAGTVIDYLTKEHGLDPRRFCLSAAGTMDYAVPSDPETPSPVSERMLEIVMLPGGR
ncbi:MAG TPA: flagellar motor protein MotB [Anaerohalosphaeraceae bacterium]|nr:hypothetical protein [Phycisphaerae bacterium]HOK94931.1 flagellar motor protein MotB [Anaerohalosphaeraceae bacterium]HOL30763.1 flagellar motor protein MotB [Anaerohalosphaeraceae bacterium]HOM75422.1 flagellar motor protein MotB [Anaerohalosphaeraceae bacterium]HPC63018.1 flagellar motor protein MotB [Anaerohalosphaeraceae bacterium]